MFKIPEPFIAFYQANLEATLALATAILEAAERLANLQLSNAKDALAENAKTARALANTKSAQELVALQPALEENIEKTLGYFRSVYEVSSQLQSEIAKIAEARMSELNNNLLQLTDNVLKNAPVGSDVALAAIRSAMVAANSAYDNFSKVTRQAVEITESNVTAATHAIGGTRKKQPVR